MSETRDTAPQPGLEWTDETLASIDAHSDPVHTIPPDDLPADACHWPACADPVCERNENGTCPLSDEIIVECSVCGAARGLGEPCANCGFAGHAAGAGEAALAATAPPTPRTQKRSSRPVLIVADDTRIIRHTQLRGLLEVAGSMKTLGEALGVDPSTISRALAGSGGELSRDERILAVRRLLGEEGS